MKKTSEELGEFSSGFGEFAQDKSDIFRGVFFVVRLSKGSPFQGTDATTLRRSKVSVKFHS